MRATMRIKFSDSAHWGGKSALIGNVSTHLKHAKGMSLRYDGFLRFSTPPSRPTKLQKKSKLLLSY